MAPPSLDLLKALIFYAKFEKINKLRHGYGSLYQM
jgi:hypothetical protein